MSAISIPTAEEAAHIQTATTWAMFAEPLARMAVTKMMTSIVTQLESEACRLIIRQVVNKFAQTVITQTAIHAVATVTTRAILMETLAAMGPIGWVIDGVLFGFTIISMIYDHYDPNNYAKTYFRKTVQGLLDDIEDQTKYETYKYAKSANIEFDYPAEIDGLAIYDTRLWKLDVLKLTQNTLLYADQLVSNLYKNSRDEIIDLGALCDTDEDIDRSLLTHPPSWNQTVQHAVESVVSSQERAHSMQRELDSQWEIWKGLAPIGWISLLSVGCTIAFCDLSKRKFTFSNRATDKPTEYMEH